MDNTTIKIANMKCGGCARSIEDALVKIDGVSGVQVILDSDELQIEHEKDLDFTKVTKKLHQMGYPEATEENGLLLQLKSYASCMVGKMKN